MKEDSALKAFALVSGFAFMMIVIIGFCIFLGIKLDAYFSVSPLFTIVLSVVGIFAGLFNLIRRVSKLEDKNEKK